MAEHKSDDLDLLLRRPHDVQGIISATSLDVRTSWPFVLIELGLHVIEAFPRPDYRPMAEMLVRRGLTRVRHVDSPAEPPTGTPRWTVFPPRPGRKLNGVYAQRHGHARGWKVVEPLFDVPPAFLPLAARRGKQCGIFLTTRTKHLTWMREQEDLVAGMLEVAQAGEMFSTTATVVD